MQDTVLFQFIFVVTQTLQHQRSSFAMTAKFMWCVLFSLKKEKRFPKLMKLKIKNNNVLQLVKISHQ